MNIEHILERLNIDSHSRCQAVQDARELIDGSPDPLSAARTIFEQLVPPGTPFTFTDLVVARMVVQFLAQEAVVKRDAYDPEQAVVDANAYVAHRRETTPWTFSVSSVSTPVATEQRAGVDVQVKNDGTLKKGSKQALAVS